MRKLIRLAEIVSDAGTQIRVALHEDTVKEYQEAYEGNAAFPPIDVFADGNRYILADGFHRVMAALLAKRPTVVAEVHSGSRLDAIKFALGANVSHGLRRTNSDKRRAVEIAVKEFPSLSQVAIAGLCCVSTELVADVQKQVAEIGNLPARTTVIGKDGKTYPLPSPPPPKPSVPQAQSAPSFPPPPPAPKPEVPKPAAVPQEKEVRRDKTGFPIPEAILPLWSRCEDIQDHLSAISALRGALRSAQESNDIAWVEVSYSTVLAGLDQAYASLRTIKPHAVCPTCQGKLATNCTLCKGRGFISEFRWDTCVPRETKELRFKVQK